MFFRPDKYKLVVGVKRRKEGTALFNDARTTLLFVYERPECRTMAWKVRSAFRVNSTERINPQWWSIAEDGRMKNDLAQDDIPSSPLYLPTLTFHGAKFTDSLKSGKPEAPERSLYVTLLSSGAIQLNVQINGEAMTPLIVDLEYRSNQG